jgi:hypothetical protein
VVGDLADLAALRVSCCGFGVDVERNGRWRLPHVGVLRGEVDGDGAAVELGGLEGWHFLCGAG